MFENKRVAVLGAGKMGEALITGMLDAGIVSKKQFIATAGHSERLEVLKGTFAPVASVGDLIALKLLSKSDARPQDAADLTRLAAVAEEKDRARARTTLRLIEERGFSRGRDLETALDALLGSG